MLKKNLKYLYFKMKYGKDCAFDYSVSIALGSSFENKCKLHHHVSFKGHLGLGSYIGEYSSLSADIGRFTSIADHVICNSGIHPCVSPNVSTSPVFYNKSGQQCGFTFTDKTLYDDSRYYRDGIAIKIGNDCWIGSSVFLCGGVKIGDGAVVLAGSVVVKDVPDYAIVGGVPAKVLKYRYSSETILFLKTVKWWDKPKDWFVENYNLLNDIEKLKNYFIRE